MNKRNSFSCKKKKQQKERDIFVCLSWWCTQFFDSSRKHRLIPLGYLCSFRGKVRDGNTMFSLFKTKTNKSSEQVCDLWMSFHHWQKIRLSFFLVSLFLPPPPAFCFFLLYFNFSRLVVEGERRSRMSNVECDLHCRYDLLSPLRLKCDPFHYRAKQE